MDLEQRIAQAEDAIRKLNEMRLRAEGRSFAYEQAMNGILSIAAPMPGVLESVHRFLNMAATIALNSTEPEIKAQAVDAAAQEILKTINEGIERAAKK